MAETVTNYCESLYGSKIEVAGKICIVLRNAHVHYFNISKDLGLDGGIFKSYFINSWSCVGPGGKKLRYIKQGKSDAQTVVS